MIKFTRGLPPGNVNEAHEALTRHLDEIEAALNRLDEPYWQNLGAGATQIKSSGLASMPIWDNANMGWSFDAAATNTIEVVLQLDHGFDEINGNNIIPAWYWSPLNTNAGNVRWQLEWKWTNPDEVAPGFTTQALTQAAAGVVAKVTRTSAAAITKVSPKIDGVVELRLSRLGADAADTHTGAAILKWAGLHIRRDDGRGSIYENAKR